MDVQHDVAGRPVVAVVTAVVTAAAAAVSRRNLEQVIDHGRVL
jgi:hypothetical protein